MSERPNDPGLTSGDPLAPGPEAPRHESGLPGLRRPLAAAAGARRVRGRLHVPPPPGASARPPGRRPAAGRYALAGWWSRVGAALIDGVIISIGAILICVLFGSVFSVGVLRLRRGRASWR